LETSGKLGSIALAEDATLRLERDMSASGLRHGRDLVPAIGAAMTEVGWSPPMALDLVALSSGPGSFTGLRIAVMFVRVLAWQTGAKIVAVPTLRLIAEAAPAEERRVAVLTDAQRCGVYWASYQREADGTLVRATEERVGPPEEAAAALPAETFLLGDGLAVHEKIFAGRRQGDPALWRPMAARLAGLAWAAHLRGEYVAAERLEPLYVRRPAPEEVEERRRRGGK
jgi:tRNA threonylcarbamoyladenosine biosynthesis protein TsaB